jgi:hypothetical protein
MTHTSGLITSIARADQPLADLGHRPGGRGQELLQPLVMNPQPLGHPLHRLAPPVPASSSPRSYVMPLSR